MNQGQAEKRIVRNIYAGKVKQFFIFLRYCSKQAEKDCRCKKTWESTKSVSVQLSATSPLATVKHLWASRAVFWPILPSNYQYIWSSTNANNESKLESGPRVVFIFESSAATSSSASFIKLVEPDRSDSPILQKSELYSTTTFYGIQTFGSKSFPTKMTNTFDIFSVE